MEKKQQKIRITHNNTGITLIALVVTIVVLIILATISINLVMNGNIIRKAEKSSEIQEKATLKERLELVKATAAIDNRGVVTVDNYMKAAIEDGVADENEIEEKNDDGSQNFVTDNGWSVNIAPDPENPNNVIITIDGKDGELKPVITKIDTSATKTSITAKAKVRHLSGGTIEYYYKLSSAADEAYTKIENITNEGVTVEELTEGTEYNVKVIAKNKNGEDTKETSITTTKTPVEQITLNKITDSVAIGETITLIATVLPTDATNKNVTWTSSDSSIAEVNSTGIVTGRKSGTVTITVETTDGSNVKATCAIMVLPLVEKITLDKTTASVAIDETVTLTATVLPTNAGNKNVTWTSSEPSVATVNNIGVVTGRKSGTTTITVAATDGSGVTATCTITVKSSLESIIGTVDSTKNRTVTDDYGNKVVIPLGFKVVPNGISNVIYTHTGTGEPSVQDGVVIQDSEGNQFVWIPVGKIRNKDKTTTTITLGRYTFDKTTGKEILQQDATDYAVPKSFSTDNCIEFPEFREGIESYGDDGQNATARNLKMFVNSTKLNGGFYLARYEASKGADGKIDSKDDKEVWIGIKQIDAAREARGMYDSGYYESDLANSYAWDTAIVFIQSYSGSVNYSIKEAIGSNIVKSGTSGDLVCNIYDMCFNAREWTTETDSGVNGKSTTPCISRGGIRTGYKYYTTIRSGVSTTGTGGGVGIRPILYIKSVE